ncbi:hypothetical protein [Pyxidicoccus sp. MSG2]|uniref:hypothetical protein n=1 Tax=Pyxidicoccus sp. MSG2 TaxID=2996790 RepID=UPI00226DAFA4|nr:hypothetical protein [Pyxidicoccus sp. MSG2]MCY1023939.1 hypothetical protein [Pyxidicoccus sp. MSG2]
MAEQPGFQKPQHVGDAFLGPRDCQLELNMFPSSADFSFVAFLESSSQLDLVAGESEWTVKSSRRKPGRNGGKPVFRTVGTFRLNTVAGTGTGVLQLYGALTLRRR